MPHLKREGVRLYYEDHGTGPAVLLTPGYTATLRMWDPQIAALATRYRLVCWDLRGHAESDSPEDPAAYAHAATVADMAAKIGGAITVVIEGAGHTPNLETPGAFNRAVADFLAAL